MKQVAGFEEYLMNEKGDVFGPRKKLKRVMHKRGYHMVTVRKQARLLHMLVARTYIPNPNGYTNVSHIDGDVTNNHISNLEWVTVQELRRRKKLNPTKKKDESIEQYEHTEAQIKQIVALHNSKPKYTIPYLSKLIGIEEQIIERYIMKYKGSKV